MLNPNYHLNHSNMINYSYHQHPGNEMNMFPPHVNMIAHSSNGYPPAVSNHPVMHQQRFQHPPQVCPPLALPQHVPYATHGNFYPDTSSNYHWNQSLMRTSTPLESLPPAEWQAECTIGNEPVVQNDEIEPEFHGYGEFDIYDILRVTYADDNKVKSRKRKVGNTTNLSAVPVKRRRRTRKEINADKLNKLKAQCKELSINCENLKVPNSVRIFGGNIVRENMPNVPRMKIAPRNEDYKRVRSLGYMITEKGLCFSCLVDNCKFKSYERDKFENHLRKYHVVEGGGAGTKEGYCNLCCKNNCGYSLMEELDHILKHAYQNHREIHPIFLSTIKNFKSSHTANDTENDITLENIDDLDIAADTILKHTSDNPESDDLPNGENEREVKSPCDSPLSANTISKEKDKDTVKSRREEKRKRIRKVFDADLSHDEQVTEKKTDKLQYKENTGFDNIPLYMLQRIRQNSVVHGVQKLNESKFSSPGFISALKSMVKSTKMFARKSTSKRSLTMFVRKSTSKSTPTMFRLINSSMIALPKCTVNLHRLEDALIKKTANIQLPAIEIKSSSEDIPDIPTPPASTTSEDSRDSLSSPITDPLQILPAFDIESRRKSPSIEINHAEKIANDSETLLSGKNMNIQSKELKSCEQNEKFDKGSECAKKCDENEPSQKEMFVNEAPKEIDRNSDSSNSDSEKEVIEITDTPPEHVEYPETPPGTENQDNASQDGSNSPPVEIYEDLDYLSRLYPWIDSNIASTVLKIRKYSELIKNENFLFSTYKCMKKTCTFYTIDFELFKSHCAGHNGKHYYCSFCLFDGISADDLCLHIRKCHKYNRYQCNQCMYRAAEKIYVKCHQNRFHVGEDCRIFKSPVQKLMKHTRDKILKFVETESSKNFVLPYICKAPNCNKKFFSKANFNEHLKKEADKLTDEKSVSEIFNQLIQIDQSKTKTFEEGENQCLYCLFGTDNEDDLTIHMTDYHAHELGFVCKRVPAITLEDEENSASETLENSTKIEYIGEVDLKVRFFKGNNEDLTEKNEHGAQRAAVVAESQSLQASTSNTVTVPIIAEVIHIDY